MRTKPPASVGVVSVEDSFSNEVVLLLSAAVSRVLLSKIAAPPPPGGFAGGIRKFSIHDQPHSQMYRGFDLSFL